MTVSLLKIIIKISNLLSSTSFLNCTGLSRQPICIGNLDRKECYYVLHARKSKIKLEIYKLDIKICEY